MQKLYLTATQVAQILQLNVGSLHDKTNDGELRATQIRGRWRFDDAELGEWLKTRRGTAPTD